MHGILKELWSVFFEMSSFMLLGLLFAGILHLVFTKKWITRHIGKNNFLSVLKSVLFGIPMPLCSCGVIPTSVYMHQNGASNAAIIAFLISTPQTGVDSIIATFGMMGWFFAIFRPLAAFFMGIFGGLSISAFTKNDQYLKLEDKKCDDSCDVDKNNSTNETIGIFKKISSVYDYAFVRFLDDISLQFIFGIFIAAVISYFLPDNFVGNAALSSGLPGMIFMIIAGIPLYICATSSIPIAISLMAKGFSPGVAFVFLTTGPVTNIVSLSILFKVLGKKITTLYVIVIALFSIMFGVLLDFLFIHFNISVNEMINHAHHNAMISVEVKTLLSIIFLILLLLSFKRKYLNQFLRKENKNVLLPEGVIKVSGMSCSHCAENIKLTLSKCEGVDSVTVDLKNALVYVSGNHDNKKIKEKINEIGYKAE